jgi:hypothetical protein
MRRRAHELGVRVACLHGWDAPGTHRRSKRVAGKPEVHRTPVARERVRLRLPARWIHRSKATRPRGLPT